jgi:hypothetical protein
MESGQKVSNPERRHLGVESEQRDELFTIFPELRNETARNLYHSARISLKAWESRVAINAMVWL